MSAVGPGLTPDYDPWGPIPKLCPDCHDMWKLWRTYRAPVHRLMDCRPNSLTLEQHSLDTIRMQHSSIEETCRRHHQ